jgi:outer membrane protein assembly factor BamB
MVASQQSTGAWQWRPSGGSGSGASISYFGSVASNNVHDGNIMWSLNASMPSILGPRNALVNQTASIQAVREGEYIIFATAGRNDERGTVPGWAICISLERGREGQKLWESSWTPPLANSGWYSADTFEGVFPDQEVIIYSSETLLKYYAFDMKTGTKLWETEPLEQMSYYGLQDIVWNNTFIAGGTHGGVLRAYDMRTGEIQWSYTAKQEGTESPYGNALVRGLYAADGKLYTSSSEHSESSPLWRTQGLRCLNITTGEEIWKILFWGKSNVRLADGMLVAFNYYDGQVYVFGKGPSATTVSAPQLVLPQGSSVTLTGTVTDQTATGRRDVNNDLHFALKGTPAISDTDMQAWMEYKFMGQAMPENAKGVPVSLDTVDPNGNYFHIGDATTDINGNYGFAYTPEIPGTYRIIATFAGSKSYYQSTGSTYLTIGEAPTQQATEQPAIALPPTEMYFALSTAAIIVAIAIIGTLMLIALRRKSFIQPTK